MPDLSFPDLSFLSIFLFAVMIHNIEIAYGHGTICIHALSYGFFKLARG
jgi:hypothetical protein